MLYGDGSGKLSGIGAAEENGKFPVTDVQNLIEGLVVDVYGAAGTVIASGLRIKSIDRVNSEITFYTTPTLSDNSRRLAAPARCASGSRSNISASV